MEIKELRTLRKEFESLIEDDLDFNGLWSGSHYYNRELNTLWEFFKHGYEFKSNS